MKFVKGNCKLVKISKIRLISLGIVKCVSYIYCNNFFILFYYVLIVIFLIIYHFPIKLASISSQKLTQREKILNHIYMLNNSELE